MDTDRFGQRTIPCAICGEPTPMTGTKRCDRCWELERRIHRNLSLATTIIIRERTRRIRAWFADADNNLKMLMIAIGVIGTCLVATIFGVK